MSSARNTSRKMGEVDTVVMFKPVMVKEEMTGGNREHGRNLKNIQLYKNCKFKCKRF